MIGNKIIKWIAFFLLLLAIVALIGLIAKLTGGFTGNLQTFYVTLDGKDIFTQGRGYSVLPTRPLQVEVYNIFSSEDATAIDYSVTVVPHIIDGTDFDFTLDDDVYSYHGEKDLTAGFLIEKEARSFTVIPKGNNLQGILQAIYPDSKIGGCANTAYEDMFTLLVTSGDGKSQVKIHFTIAGNTDGIYLNREVIVF